MECENATPCCYFSYVRYYFNDAQKMKMALMLGFLGLQILVIFCAPLAQASARFSHRLVPIPVYIMKLFCIIYHGANVDYSLVTSVSSLPHS